MDYAITGVSADAFQNFAMQIFIITSLVQVIKAIFVRYDVDTVWLTPIGIVIGIGTQIIIVIFSESCAPAAVLSAFQYGTLFGLASNGTFDLLKFASKAGDAKEIEPDKVIVKEEK